MTAGSARGGSKSSTRRYHHGALREALIDGAAALLADRTAAFSLNEVARRAGVSSAAPYRHFANKDALLAAVARRGYLLLGEAAALPFPEGAGPADRLLLLCVRYLGFAAANPALYGTMFQEHLPAGPNDVGLKSFGPFVAAVEDAMRSGAMPAGDVMEVSFAAWAALHGATSAYLVGTFKALGGDAPPATIVTRTLRTCFPHLASQWTDAELADLAGL
ncbi:TetR/AcrR family transcriptional regulator [Arthrobacter castelli]|uniref:TetR/AcrR family transcriptional regulator n=1 Tax=Arthrobacter castelli TaxID=271431 RepID=UPI00040787C7|nr:TetR/AcrR family transcriptional regulator [Arthrobacter castelli]